ncbi:hypothetical protein [Shewanella sp.]|uniref:hypothetical protein n=1 Tax=Shewanella sp. TaxID=50422 RepID=UPI003A8B3735
MSKQTKDEWVSDNLFRFHIALESQFQRGLICPICHNDAGWGVPYNQPTDERIRILCGRCGYVMDFHGQYVKNILDSAKELPDNE